MRQSLIAAILPLMCLRIGLVQAATNRSARCPPYLQLRSPDRAAELFDGARVLACPASRRVDIAMWGFWGSGDFWPLTHVDPRITDLALSGGMLRFVPQTNVVTLGFGRFEAGDPAATLKKAQR